MHGGVEERLRQHLENVHFFSCLGTAYAGEYRIFRSVPLQPVDEKKISLASVLPLLGNQEVQIDISASKVVFRDILPFSLTNERSLSETINTIYTSSSKERLYLTSWEGLDVTAYKNECIAWFPAW